MQVRSWRALNSFDFRRRCGLHLAKRPLIRTVEIRDAIQCRVAGDVDHGGGQSGVVAESGFQIFAFVTGQGDDPTGAAVRGVARVP